MSFKNELKNLTVQETRKPKKSADYKWIMKILVIAFMASLCMGFISEMTIPKANIFVGILITLIFILVGILFDIIGVSVTSANPKVFHSMNSRKVKGADIAVKLTKNADKVSNFCCDVIGDVCGVISGSAAASISVTIAINFGFNPFITSLIVTGLIASLTIGGKAIGKSYAINKSDIILFETSKVISCFYKIKKN